VHCVSPRSPVPEVGLTVLEIFRSLLLVFSAGPSMVSGSPSTRRAGGVTGRKELRPPSPSAASAAVMSWASGSRRGLASDVRSRNRPETVWV
jgi:hypothetical protein